MRVDRSAHAGEMAILPSLDRSSVACTRVELRTAEGRERDRAPSAALTRLLRPERLSQIDAKGHKSSQPKAAVSCGRTLPAINIWWPPPVSPPLSTPSRYTYGDLRQGTFDAGPIFASGAVTPVENSHLAVATHHSRRCGVGWQTFRSTLPPLFPPLAALGARSPISCAVRLNTSRTSASLTVE